MHNIGEYAANEWILMIILLVAVIILFLRYSYLKGKVEDRSIELFDNWKQKELDQLMSQYDLQTKMLTIAEML